MTSASEIAAQPLAFTVAEFRLFQDVDLAERTRNLLYSDFLGVAISAPIDEPSGAGFSQGAAYPIAVGYRMPGARLWDAPIARNAVLVARNLVDGAARGLTSLLGEWHLTLIWYDWASNELSYRVQGEPDPPPPAPGFPACCA